MTTLFSPPKIPRMSAPSPQPPQNPQLEAELASLGKRQGMLAALTRGPKGVENRGTTQKAKLTGG